jgi:hypothetical protein
VVVLNKVVWGILWKDFRSSCGEPTRSVGPTVRSASLLVGRTHLSVTALSLVGGDLGVPMSHNCTMQVVEVLILNGLLISMRFKMGRSTMSGVHSSPIFTLAAVVLPSVAVEVDLP